jgi:hypothetical protein
VIQCLSTPDTGELGDISCPEYVHEITVIEDELLIAERPIHDSFLIAILVPGLPLKVEPFFAGVINNPRLQDTAKNKSTTDNFKAVVVVGN